MVKINIKKKNRELSQMGVGGGGPSNFGSISLFFIFKHGLNHPEMQRNVCSPFGDPPSLNDSPAHLHGHFIKQNQDEDN